MADRLVFALETIGSAMADGLEDLIAFNWDEVRGRTEGVPALEIDWPRYLMFERMGIYHAVSARQANKLIGYAGYFVQPPARHKSQVWAINDALYVDSDHRGGLVGLKLLDAAEGFMRELGAKLIVQGDMSFAEPADFATAKSRATFGKLLSRRGYRPWENVYVKPL